MLQFVPWHRYAIELLRGGHLPLWNPLLGAGAPLLANYQSALLYPPNLLLLLTGPEYGHGLLVFLHLIWAGLGMRALARRLGMQPAGQMISALAFSLSGYMVSRAGFISINHTAAWLPWLVMALDSFLDRVRTGGVVLALAATITLAVVLVDRAKPERQLVAVSELQQVISRSQELERALMNLVGREVPDRGQGSRAWLNMANGDEAVTLLRFAEGFRGSVQVRGDRYWRRPVGGH